MCCFSSEAKLILLCNFSYKLSLSENCTVRFKKSRCRNRKYGQLAFFRRLKSCIFYKQFVVLRHTFPLSTSLWMTECCCLSHCQSNVLKCKAKKSASLCTSSPHSCVGKIREIEKIHLIIIWVDAWGEYRFTLTWFTAK